MSLKIPQNEQFALVAPIEPAGLAEVLKGLPGRAFVSIFEQVNFVLSLAQQNISETPEASPFAAAIFNRQGEVVGAGVDFPDRLRGHELNNSLTRAIRQLDAAYEKRSELTVVSVTPACLRCFDELVKFSPGKVISITFLSDLIEVLNLPEPQLSPSNWTKVLETNGVIAVEGMYRELGLNLLKTYNKELFRQSPEN